MSTTTTAKIYCEGKQYRRRIQDVTHYSLGVTLGRAQIEGELWIARREKKRAMGRNHALSRQPERLTVEEYRRQQRKQPAKRRARDYVGVLLGQLDAAGLPAPKREVPFPGLCGTRKWRFDLAWPNARVAVEYQGGVFSRAASHSSIGGLLRDYEKFTEASVAGWTLLLVTARDVRTGRALAWIERAVRGR